MEENNQNEELQSGEKIIKVNLENQMKSAYIDYSMSVIISRALPDVRDGLKPVHRRVLYGMLGLGVTSHSGYKKSARIVGEVLGKYHPHGDSSVYDAMVRMAQNWSLRYPLVDGQGNFGSVDGDSPAAMRYTEARLKKIAEEMLDDLDKDTVDFQNNFDDSLQEPTVLPTQIPALLVNGSNGIAVGMATNMAPHNLSECVDGIIAYIDNNDITVQELMEFIKAPDFPTAGVIYGYEGVREAFETGRGRIVVRGEATIEEHNGHERIIATSIPYQVNKADMIKKTADLVNDKKLDGIADIRDESDRKGIRIVYELKRDANAEVVLNKLYQMTALQSSFNVNNVALVNGRPYTLNLKDLIISWITAIRWSYAVPNSTSRRLRNVPISWKVWPVPSTSSMRSSPPSAPVRAAPPKPSRLSWNASDSMILRLPPSWPTASVSWPDWRSRRSWTSWKTLRKRSAISTMFYKMWTCNSRLSKTNLPKSKINMVTSAAPRSFPLLASSALRI